MHNVLKKKKYRCVCIYTCINVYIHYTMYLILKWPPFEPRLVWLKLGEGGLGGGRVSQRVEYRRYNRDKEASNSIFVLALQYRVKYMIKRYFVQKNTMRLIDYRIIQT